MRTGHKMSEQGLVAVESEGETVWAVEQDAKRVSENPRQMFTGWKTEDVLSSLNSMSGK